MPDESRVLEVLRLGQKNYDEVWTLQKELLAKRVDDQIHDTLILVEHEPIVTVGRGAQPEQDGSLGISVRETERGGEATYHGPGQVVAYPIIKLPDGRRDIHRYLRDLEEVVIRVLAEVEVAGSRRDGFTGVWIGEQKVCSIGVAVRRWVTWHGFALNVHTDLTQFQRFRPCGLDPDVMTRVADHAEIPPASLLFEVLTVKHFLDVFGLVLPAAPALPDTASDEGPFPDLPIFPG
ncbi:MAG: lipoyl(octanoyl) transferase [Chlamydiales bacterium]|jgi:lipoyl(octanoyl) transferase